MSINGIFQSIRIEYIFDQVVGFCNLIFIVSIYSWFQIDGLTIGTLDDIPSGPVTQFFRSISRTLDFDFEDDNEGLFPVFQIHSDNCNKHNGLPVIGH